MLLITPQDDMDSGNENISLPTENEDEGADIVSKTGIDSEIKIEIRSENNLKIKKILKFPQTLQKLQLQKAKK